MIYDLGPEIFPASSQRKEVCGESRCTGGYTNKVPSTVTTEMSLGARDGHSGRVFHK